MFLQEGPFPYPLLCGRYVPIDDTDSRYSITWYDTGYVVGTYVPVVVEGYHLSFGGTTIVLVLDATYQWARCTESNRTHKLTSCAWAGQLAPRPSDCAPRGQTRDEE